MQSNELVFQPRKKISRKLQLIFSQISCSFKKNVNNVFRVLSFLLNVKMKTLFTLSPLNIKFQEYVFILR